MDNSDWQKVESIFHEALNLNNVERNEYLLQECAGNDEMCKEVNSLISAFEEEAGFMENPAFSLGIKVLQKNEDARSLDSGQKIGAYQIIEKIGSGGMGDVYLAEDTKLNRKVALKFLSPALVGDKWAKKRLIKEAQAVAMLDHPNICAVYGLEEIEDHNFIIMQYVEGKTLAELIKEDLLKQEQIISFAKQTVQALAVAHSSGIIHRDIKPGNIMITPGEQVKVLDFGLAKVVQDKQDGAKAKKTASQLSQKGVILGTLAYMSPEQLRSEKLDYKSDIFSVGTVLYELVSGKNPFESKSNAETISKILKGEPRFDTDLSKSVSPNINKIIEKCLNKDKEKRYSSASELLLELQDYKEISFQKASYINTFRFVIAGIFLTFLIVFGIFAYLRATKIQSLAILPFANKSADMNTEYISHGMAESLINKLSGSNKVNVKSYSIVSRYKGNEIDPLKIGRELNVEVVVFGELVKRNNSLFVKTKLISTADGLQIWETENNISTTDPLTLSNNLSEKILSSIEPWKTERREDIKTIPIQTQDPKAFKYYLYGKYYWEKRDKENILKAIEFFQKAIDTDPSYARAYAGLADSYVMLNSVAYGAVPSREAMIKAKAAAKRSIEIDDQISEAHTSLGIILLQYDWDLKGAEIEFKRALELNPENPTVHYWYSVLLALTERKVESIDESQIAKELDPFSTLFDVNLARSYYYARQYDQALRVLIEKSGGTESDIKIEYMLGLVYLQKERYQEAIKIFQKIYDSNKSLGGPILGHIYGKIGKREEALQILDELDQLSKEKFLPPQEKAMIYIGLNDKDKAFEHLEKAYQEGFPGLIAIKTEPLFDSLRSDKRYSELVKRIFPGSD